MASRQKNQRKFPHWIDLPNGGRRYWRDILGGYQGSWARYLKEVDAQEQTTKFWQEIYDKNGQLIEIHEKYPVDTGHRSVKAS